MTRRAALLTLWASPSRRIVAMRPSAEGHYSFHGLPDGEYRLAALNDVEDGQWFEPRLLRELVGASLFVRLEAGKGLTQDIRIK